MVSQEAELGLCCGNSLGGVQLNAVQRDLIRIDALNVLQKNNPNYIATACPLCKKTFVKSAETDVKDIAEIIWLSMQNSRKPKFVHEIKQPKEEAVIEL